MKPFPECPSEAGFDYYQMWWKLEMTEEISLLTPFDLAASWLSRQMLALSIAAFSDDGMLCAS